VYYLFGFFAPLPLSLRLCVIHIFPRKAAKEDAKAQKSDSDTTDLSRGFSRLNADDLQSIAVFLQ
jgi:hypothetical protein